MKKTIITLTILTASVFCFGQNQYVKPDTTTYYLLGKIGDFQLLLKAIMYPGQMSREDISKAVEIINSLQRITLTSKEADKPKEKPKN